MSGESILITGAAGRIATMVREGLGDGYKLSGVDMVAADGWPESAVADLRDFDAICPLFEGKDFVIDFANNPAGNLSWEDAYENNIRVTFNSMRAAQLAGVRRYIYTSSNRITEEYQQDFPYSAICRGEYDGLDPAAIPLIDSTMPVRPNGPYGIGKAAAEAAGRYFADKHGMSVICLRLGTMGREGVGPRDKRQFATTLTPRDLQQLYRCAVEAPAGIKFAAFYGVSNNKWRFWDISDAERLIGYRPQDDMEAWR